LISQIDMSLKNLGVALFLIRLLNSDCYASTNEIFLGGVSDSKLSSTFLSIGNPSCFSCRVGLVKSLLLWLVVQILFSVNKFF